MRQPGQLVSDMIGHNYEAPLVCTNCGKTRANFYAVPGKTLCTSCYKEHKANSCQACGRGNANLYTIPTGQKLCTHCYRNYQSR